MSNKAPCTVCGRAGGRTTPLGESETWQCSHVDFPHRNRQTAGPSDGFELDAQPNLTSHKQFED